MKKGFGLLEVMAAAVVLGFMLVALLNLQLGNRQALLRIRARDVAVQLAQEYLDKLQAMGAANIPTADCGENMELKEHTHTWQGNPSSKKDSESLSTGTTTYNILCKYGDYQDNNDHPYKKEETSKLIEDVSDYEDKIDHREIAKHVDIEVSWLFKNTTFSTKLSGVIR